MVRTLFLEDVVRRRQPGLLRLPPLSSSPPPPSSSSSPSSSTLSLAPSSPSSSSSCASTTSDSSTTFFCVSYRVAPPRVYDERAVLRLGHVRATRSGSLPMPPSGDGPTCLPDRGRTRWYPAVCLPSLRPHCVFPSVSRRAPRRTFLSLFFLPLFSLRCSRRCHGGSSSAPRLRVTLLILLLPTL